VAAEIRPYACFLNTLAYVAYLSTSHMVWQGSPDMDAACILPHTLHTAITCWDTKNERWPPCPCISHQSVHKCTLVPYFLAHCRVHVTMHLSAPKINAHSYSQVCIYARDRGPFSWPQALEQRDGGRPGLIVASSLMGLRPCENTRLLALFGPLHWSHWFCGLVCTATWGTRTRSIHYMHGRRRALWHCRIILCE